MLASAAIAVALSEGVEEFKVGAVLSASPKNSSSFIWCKLPDTTEVTKYLK